MIVCAAIICQARGPASLAAATASRTATVAIAPKQTAKLLSSAGADVHPSCITDPTLDMGTGHGCREGNRGLQRSTNSNVPVAERLEDRLCVQAYLS